jgi:HupE / UreJ protein
MHNNRKYIFKVPAMLLLSFVLPQFLFAHDVVGELENMSKTDAAFLYLKLGFEHILPLGLDHILFVLSLYLLSPKLKPVLWQATAFTIAHSITLGLAMFNVITPPAAIVEPIIALSILYVALENIFSPGLKKSRIGIIFLFGLVHGMGFANALGELGLPQKLHHSLCSMLVRNLDNWQLSLPHSCCLENGLVISPITGWQW